MSPNSISAVHATAFLLDPTQLPKIHRVVAFDSGAMEHGLYKSAMHPHFTIRDFEVDPEVRSIAKIVDLFYGSDERYCAGEVLQVGVPASFPEAQCYRGLLSSDLEGDADDRKSCIEVQFSTQIDLNDKTVAAVILAKQAYHDPAIKNFIDNVLKAEAITYLFTRARPSDDARMIMEKAFDFYQKRGWI